MFYDKYSIKKNKFENLFERVFYQYIKGANWICSLLRARVESGRHLPVLSGSSITSQAIMY